MIFTKEDKETIQSIKNQLCSLTSCVALRADVGLVVSKLDAIMQFQQQELQRQNNTAVYVCERLDALAESQGKLLAALNDIGGNISTNDSLIMGHLQAIDNRLDAMDAGLHETAMRNHAQVLARLRRPRKKARSAVGKAR